MSTKKVNWNAVNAIATAAGVMVTGLGVYFSVLLTRPRMPEAQEPPPQIESPARPAPAPMNNLAPVAPPPDDVKRKNADEDGGSKSTQTPKRKVKAKAQSGKQAVDTPPLPTMQPSWGGGADLIVVTPLPEHVPLPQAAPAPPPPTIDRVEVQARRACESRADWAFRNGKFCEARDDERETKVISLKEWSRATGRQGGYCEPGFDLYKNRRGDYECFRIVG